MRVAEARRGSGGRNNGWCGGQPAVIRGPGRRVRREEGAAWPVAEEAGMAPGGRLLGVLLLLLCTGAGRPEYVRLFRVQEGVPAGTRIGFIGEAEVRRAWVRGMLGYDCVVGCQKC